MTEDGGYGNVRSLSPDSPAPPMVSDYSACCAASVPVSAVPDGRAVALATNPQSGWMTTGFYCTREAGHPVTEIHCSHLRDEWASPVVALIFWGGE